MIPEYYPSRILGGEKTGLCCLKSERVKPSKWMYAEAVLIDMEER